MEATMNELAQAGILDTPPEHLLAAALTLETADAPTTLAALQALQNLEQQELTSVLPPQSASTPKTAPSPETGEVGFDDGFERYSLTITTGLGSRVFDLLGTAQSNRPQDLIPIPWPLLADTPAIAANGDVLLQICGNSLVVCEHVLHRVLFELGPQFSLAWVVQGVQRHNSRYGPTSRAEGRSIIGFRDGTSNLDPRCSAADAALVFCGRDGPPLPPLPSPGPGPNPYGPPQQPEFPPDLRPPCGPEPAWATGGTYAVIRASVIDFARWDTATLATQEAAIGRFKYSGQPLSATDDPTTGISDPSFGSDPTGATTSLSSHIRKANPRGPDDDLRRFYRRGYPLVIATPAQGLQRGLVFVAFARTICTQFEFVTRAWTTNPNFPTPGAGSDQLRTFESVLCGGYFFIPPIASQCAPWSWTLPT
jgi:deferrochelatase/peroxidase EfeB